MKNFYVSSRDERSALGKYSRDFYSLVLQEKGYEFIDSSEDISSILSMIASKDIVHIELDAGRDKELELLKIMIGANYRHVVVTLHYPHLFHHPLIVRKNKFLNFFSGIYHYLIGKKQITDRILKRIKCIYVLSPYAKNLLESSFGLQNVVYIHRVPLAIKDKFNN